MASGATSGELAKEIQLFEGAPNEPDPSQPYSEPNKIPFDPMQLERRQKKILLEFQEVADERVTGFEPVKALVCKPNKLN